MSLENSAERTFDVVDLEDGEPDFLACLNLRVEVANGYLFPSCIAADIGLRDVFGIALDGAHLRSLRGKR